MRTILLLPFLASTAFIAGCGPEGREQAARSVPQRDLTLVTSTAEVKFASPVETQQLRAQHRTVRSSPSGARRAPASRSRRPEAKVVLTPATAAELPATPANDRELLPGKTVTLIPASTGPSIGSDGTDAIPTVEGRGMVVRGGGGTCRGGGRGRRPGIGIATAPRPDFRSY